MVGLTPKQQEELNLAILEYLRKKEWNTTADNFVAEAKITEEINTESNISTRLKTGQLESKWTSVVRLKKQVMELEKSVKQFKENTVCERCADLDSVLGTGGKGMGDGMPREPQKYVLTGHRARVTKVAIHPMYNLCASAGEDAAIRIWDYEQGEHERTLKSHSGKVSFVAFSPNGQTLASCATDMTIKLWSMQTFAVVKTLEGHEHEVSSVAFMSSGNFLLSCSRDETIRIWDTNLGTCVQKLTEGHHDWVRRVAVCPQIKQEGITVQQTQLFASASKDETIVVWDFDKAKHPDANRTVDAMVQVLQGHTNVIDCIVFAPFESAKTIQLGDFNLFKGSGGETIINETRTPETNQNSQENESDPSQHVEEKVDMQKLSQKERIELLKKRKEDMKRKIEAKRKATTETETKASNQMPLPEEEVKEHGEETMVGLVKPSLNPDQVKDYLASGARDKLIKIWEVKSGQCVLTLQGHDNWVTDLAFHPNGRFLLSVSDDKTLRAWDLNSGRCYRKLPNLHAHMVTTIAIKQKTCISASVDQTLKVWNCR